MLDVLIGTVTIGVPIALLVATFWFIAASMKRGKGVFF